MLPVCILRLPLRRIFNFSRQLICGFCYWYIFHPNVLIFLQLDDDAPSRYENVFTEFNLWSWAVSVLTTNPFFCSLIDRTFWTVGQYNCRTRTIMSGISFGYHSKYHCPCNHIIFKMGFDYWPASAWHAFYHFSLANFLAFTSLTKNAAFFN